MDVKKYLIISIGEVDEDGSHLYWSNDLGWVDRDSATWFDDTSSRLPMGGRWVRGLI